MSQRDLLYTRVTGRGLEPAHVAEVGVWMPETSNIYRFIQDGVRTTLVEPDPGSIKAIRKTFADRDNLTLHPVAIMDRPGPIQLVQRGPSTYVARLGASPAVVNDAYSFKEGDAFTVQATTFDTIDDGTIDLLSVDVEGAEYYILQGLRSRPAVLSLETHGALYINPRLDEIAAWIEQHGYVVWYRTRSDTVYVRPERLRPGFMDRLRLSLMNAYLKLRRVRKKLGPKPVPPAAGS